MQPMKNPTWPKALAFIGFAIMGLTLAYYSTAIATAGVTARILGSDRSGDWLSTGSAVLMVGNDCQQDGAAEDRADGVPALRDRDEHERGDEEAIAHEAERRDGEAPRRDREEHRDSLTPHALRPTRRKRGDERPDARRGEE